MLKFVSVKNGLILVAGLILALGIALFVSGTLKAPEAQDTSPYQSGQSVEVSGELVCLPHKNQDGPQTLECAIGFIDEDGNYYGLRDMTDEHALVGGTPMGERVLVEGVFKDEMDDKYQQVGVIDVARIGIID